MSLTEEYKRQFAWRDWDTALKLCPIANGQRVLDLGCGLGDLSRELAARGAIVTGIDTNPELLAAATKACPPPLCHFIEESIADLNLDLDVYDGLWCSFAAAYFTNFEDIFRTWVPALKEKAWVCLIEVDDLFGHEPLPAWLRQKIEKFYCESYTEAQYDFKAGRKLEATLVNSGFKVQTILLEDQELSFQGPAGAGVLKAWEERLSRMRGPKHFFRDEFPEFKQKFMEALSSTNHKANCRVYCSVGWRT